MSDNDPPPGVSGPPIFLFDKNETIFPVSIDFFLRSCTLWKDGVQIEGANVDHHQINSSLPDASFYYLKREGPINDSAHPVSYRFHSDDGQTMVYSLFFMINGPIGVFRLGRHDFDIERVAINNTERWIWFGRHNGGKRIPFMNCRWQGERPLIYVSRGSHAMGSHPGIYQRFYGMGNDICDAKSRRRWDNYYIEDVTVDNHRQPWDFAGSLNESGGQRLPLFREVGWKGEFVDKTETGEKYSCSGCAH